MNQVHLKSLLLKKKEKNEIKYMAEELNNFFTNAGSNFHQENPNSLSSFTSFLNETL